MTQTIELLMKSPRELTIRLSAAVPPAIAHGADDCLDRGLADYVARSLSPTDLTQDHAASEHSTALSDGAPSRVWPPARPIHAGFCVFVVGRCDPAKGQRIRCSDLQ